MTLGRWRQQARLLQALRLLARGEPVTSIAQDVGYESPSAFIADLQARARDDTRELLQEGATAGGPAGRLA